MVTNTNKLSKINKLFDDIYNSDTEFINSDTLKIVHKIKWLNGAKSERIMFVEYCSADDSYIVNYTVKTSYYKDDECTGSNFSVLLNEIIFSKVSSIIDYITNNVIKGA